MRIILSIILSISFSSGAATYWVAGTGDDGTGSGSYASPWRSLQKAFGTLAAGDTLYVTNGSFQSSSNTIITQASGTSNSLIRIIGCGTNRVHLRVYQRHPYWWWESINSGLPDVSGAGWTIDSTNGHHVTWTNNVVVRSAAFDFFTDPPSVDGPADCLVINNTITNATTSTLVTITGKRIVFQGNTMDTGGTGYDCIRLFGESNVLRGNFISAASNPTNSNHTDCVQAFSSNAERSYGHLIDGNTFTGAGGQLANLEDQEEAGWVSDWIWVNNIIRDTTGQANIYTKCHWINNTFVNCTATLLLQFKASDTKGTPHGSTVVNNIFARSGTPSSNPAYGIYVISSGITNCVADYNYAVGPTGNLTKDNNENEPHYLTGVEPNFYDESGNDFSPTESSPFVGVGVNVDSFVPSLAGYGSYDRNGVARGTTWDIGAFEYSGDAPAGPNSVSVRANVMRIGRIVKVP